MKILALHNGTGSRFYRLIPQLKHMQSAGHEARLERHDTEHVYEKIAWADVVIVQSLFSSHMMKQIKTMKKTLIFECDDLFHSVPKTHYSYKETAGLNKIKWLWRIYTTLRHCDGFISTNKNLDRIYGWMARKSLVFPNYLELEHWLKEPKKNLSSDKIRILWAGSTSHTGDLEWFKPIIAEIMRRYPQVQFIYVGHGGVPTDDLYAKFVYGDDIFEGLPQERRESLLPVPPNVWAYTLASLQADIGVCPLEKNYFNKFKSQCKYLEYAVNGIPGIYSRWHYTDVKEWQTGVLADSPAEWIDKLSFLIENSKMRSEIGEAARTEVVNNFDISKYVTDWRRFVENLYESSHHS